MHQQQLHICVFYFLSIHEAEQWAEARLVGEKKCLLAVIYLWVFTHLIKQWLPITHIVSVLLWVHTKDVAVTKRCRCIPHVSTIIVFIFRWYTGGRMTKKTSWNGFDLSSSEVWPINMLLSCCRSLILPTAHSYKHVPALDVEGIKDEGESPWKTPSRSCLGGPQLPRCIWPGNKKSHHTP